MGISRRRLVQSLAGAVVLGARSPRLAAQGGGGLNMPKTFDVAVVGAGVFGAWTARQIQRAGKRVILVDAYGPSNSRASSGGESRIIRMAYGKDEIYTRWSLRALGMWKEFFQRSNEQLFYPTGVLLLAGEGDAYATASVATLARLGVKAENLSRQELERRYPQIALGKITWGLLEPESGVLMARRAVQVLVRETLKEGADYAQGVVATPNGQGQLKSVKTAQGDEIRAGDYVFACGPWLPKVFPELLRGRIFPTRQEVFFFGPPGGETRFQPPAFPAWICRSDATYGVPDLENRGVKIASDDHGPDVDPDAQQRIVGPESVQKMREYLGERFPALRDAPVVETRVCQYENTSNGDFLIDRHPAFSNVWLIGGGSGHGFKHGPALGQYVAERILEGGAIDPRFSLASKATMRNRTVF